jgi:osmotically-inducible protein OsmY
MTRQRLILMSLFLTTAGAMATAVAGQAAPIADDEIRRGVERALHDLASQDNGDIRVRVVDGVVWLSGSVPTWQGTSARLHATRSVPGVRSIMNELRAVSPSATIESHG